MFYAVFALLLMMTFALPFLLFPWLAEENILFAKVNEGTVKTIMRGDSFDRFIMSFAGYHLNDPSKAWYNKPEVFADWEVVPHEKGTDNRYEDRSWLLKHLGLYWVGWPWASSVYVYEFRWNETESAAGTGKEEIRPRNEPTDFVYVSDFTYAIVTDGAETKDRLATDELTLVTVAVRNPYLSLFAGEDWMRRITSAINRDVRDFIGQHPFDKIISEKSEWREFSKGLIELNTRLPDDPISEPHPGLKGRYGVEIRAADLQSIELAGESKKMNQEATAKEYVARQEAIAATLAADANAYAIKKIADAEAAALKMRLEVIKEHGDAGIALAGYDAIQEASQGPGNSIIWANDPLAAVGSIIGNKGK